MPTSRIGLTLLIIATAACAARPPSPVAAGGTSPASRTADADALPDGAGKRILQTHCTWCHDLGEVTKFNGFYNRAQWRDVVVTMVEYGAKVETDDVEVLSDYLVEHLGRR